MAVQIEGLMVAATLFQLRLLGVSNCENWRVNLSPILLCLYNNYVCIQANDPTSKDIEISQAVVDNMAPRCGCAFTEDRITDRIFHCFPSSPHTVTYRARLHGTREATVTELIQYIEEWVQEGTAFPVQLQLLTVDSTCDVRVSSFTESECRAGHTGDDDTPTLLPGAVVGTMAVLIFATVIAATLVVVLIAAARRRRRRGLAAINIK